MTSTSAQRLTVKLPCMTLAQVPKAIYSIATYPDGGVSVITHRLLSNSSLRPQRRAHIRCVSITDYNTNTCTAKLHEHGRLLINMTLCVYAQVTSCENDRGCDHPRRIQIEHNKCSSVRLANSHYIATLGVYATPLPAAMRGFSLPFEGRQTVTEPSQQLPLACWNDPQHHYLTST